MSSSVFDVQVDQFINRLLVEEDARGSGEQSDELFLAAADAGQKLYERGAFAESRVTNVDSYLLKKVCVQILMVLLSIVFIN